MDTDGHEFDEPATKFVVVTSGARRVESARIATVKAQVHCDVVGLSGSPPRGYGRAGRPRPGLPRRLPGVWFTVPSTRLSFPPSS